MVPTMYALLSEGGGGLTPQTPPPPPPPPLDPPLRRQKDLLRILRVVVSGNLILCVNILRQIFHDAIVYIG